MAKATAPPEPPYRILTVARMTELVVEHAPAKVLEVGTGSGYQTAVLSLLCDTVYSIDLLAPLTNAAAERLEALGYRNILTKTANGYEGWPEHAPFDGIIVTAAAPDMATCFAISRALPSPRIAAVDGRTTLSRGGTVDSGR